MKKETFEWIISILLAVLAVFLIMKYLFVTYNVSGLSMYPTFDDKDRVIVSKISKTFNHIEHGDIIVFHQKKHQDFIKRVIAKEGDSVIYKDDVLYINNKEVKEPYLDSNKKNKLGNQLTNDFTLSDINGAEGSTIPKNHFLVLGDNRENSLDSRDKGVGLIRKDQIVGKVIFRFLPLNEWRFNFS
ncbi:signal peptidase I [Staphylococcus hyicus]|uniref:signal peptidase I n=1 Tax=Staphylococcus hyicus TaxID=1284 RepID=UPI001430C337|nr:signal peptidase I [Staphylococcus hyicus]MDP4448389.1 signal peptidase I [Staphylococcus hyicus]MDY3698021.1 signal peptidase I [Staphylococcus hyicus]NJI00920.1 signal peptidase I [Staphylococcus hyicus]NJI30765.1 signal peptidase I [Staphylococcus hyicus]